MTPEKANKEVAKRFVYITDKKKYGFFETWAVMDTSEEKWTGDCEDYSLTVLWLISNKSKRTFLFNILLNPDYGMKFVRYIKTGEGHAVLNYKDQYCDNIQKSWFSKNNTKKYNQYHWKWPIPGPLICINLILGKVIKLFNRKK